MLLYSFQWLRVVSSGSLCRNLGSKKTRTEKDTDNAVHTCKINKVKARNASYLAQTNR